MKTHSVNRVWGWTIAAMLLISFSSLAQDQGFDVIYEGVVDQPEGEAPAANFDLSLYGVGGLSGAGAFWATAGARAAFSIGGFGVHADASYGLNGYDIRVGAETSIAGFGVAGDVTLRQNWSPTVDVRAWGSIGSFSLTANAQVARRTPTITLTASTHMGGFGLSANLAMVSGALSQASVGANRKLGGFTVSGSAGMVGGQFNVGGGAGLQLGAFSLVANAGYDAGVGINAILSGAVGWEAFELHVVGLYDNTGIGFEVSSQMALGTLTLSFTGRFAGTNLNAEVGGGLAMGALNVKFSVAFGTQTGFSWAEIGFELPL